MRFKTFLLFVVYLMIVQISPSIQQFRSLILERQTLHSYCSSLKTCNDCKNGAVKCEWCHDVGCTNFPRLHCPKKVIINNFLKKQSSTRYCTEIVSRSPIFVAADIQTNIKLDLMIDDMTLYERNIVCEVRVDNNVLQVKGMLDKNTVNCDAISVDIQQSIRLGSIRLIWGGVEPYSNVILMVVYKCHQLAQTCMECQSLSKEFQCGWCKDTSVCNLEEECPRLYGPWVDKNYSCEKYDSKAFSQFKMPFGRWH